jgi:hypothetical protein
VASLLPFWVGFLEPCGIGISSPSNLSPDPVVSLHPLVVLALDLLGLQELPLQIGPPLFYISIHWNRMSFAPNGYEIKQVLPHVRQGKHTISASALLQPLIRL